MKEKYVIIKFIHHSYLALLIFHLDLDYECVMGFLTEMAKLCLFLEGNDLLRMKILAFFLGKDHLLLLLETVTRLLFGVFEILLYLIIKKLVTFSEEIISFYLKFMIYLKYSFFYFKYLHWNIFTQYRAW